MKNIYKFILGAAALVAFAACSDLNTTPVFQDEDSFAAFNITTAAVEETTPTISIPVKIASIDPKKTVVAFEVIDKTKDSTFTATEGVDFKLVDPSASLAFSGTERQANVEIEIINHAGTYTGDLTFALKITSASGLKVGYDKTVVVTIQDLDHPLSSILGVYNVSAIDIGGNAAEWTSTFIKDPKDVSIVWINNVCNSDSRAIANIYGVVSEDLNSITIPTGQKFQYNSSYFFSLWTYDGGEYLLSPETVPSVTLEKNAEGTGFELKDYGWCMYVLDAASGSGLGYWDLYLPGISYIKK